MSEENKSKTIPINKEISRVSNDLSWSDIVFLSQQNLGLRHVSKRETAEKEEKYGIIYGDAVSLSSPNYFVPPESLENISMENKGILSQYFSMGLPGGIDLKSLNFSIIMSLGFLSEKNKQQIISDFSEAIKNFIEDSIGMDINKFSTSNSIIAEVLSNLTTKYSFFLLAKFRGANIPYDQDKYYGLGKCGKQDVPPENIVTVLNNEENLTTIASNLTLSEEELKMPVSKEKFNLIKKYFTESIWRKFVLSVSKRAEKTI